jgi:hypothetical protein
MHTLKRVGFLVVLGVLCGFGASAQSASVTPDYGVSGMFGTWTVTYTAGTQGIAEGGAIRVQLPDTWHAGPRNSANRLQASDPRDDHYVKCGCSRDDVQVRAIVEGERGDRLIKHAKDSLDGRSERYVFVVRCEVLSGTVREGDTVSVVYGDTSGGSRGYRAASIATQSEPILVAVDANGGGEFTLHPDQPRIVSLPGKPVEMQVHLPSQAVVGQPIEALIAIIDKEGNGVHDAAAIRFPQHIHFELPQVVELPAESGYVRFNVTPRGETVLRIAAHADELGLSASSNPCIVSAIAPETSIFWGDLHSHTGFSWDGVGAGSFDYARHIAGLDFYAKTDHSREPAAGRSRGLNAANWGKYAAETDHFHDPPAFVAIHAYECSFGRPYGHHNVYFRGAPGALLNPETSTLPELWAALTEGDALTIPHHTGKFPNGVDFGIHDPRFRRNFEMYSGHGLSEAYDPSHPLAFEHSLFTNDAKSLDEPTHIQDTWGRGLRLSAIASSDDHRSHPGMPHYGLAAVRATENSRDAIFQALYDRQTYATTGAKILLNLRVNGSPMGESVSVDGTPEIAIAAHGTDMIVWVEVLRYRPGDTGFEVIQRWEPGTLDFTVTTRDAEWNPGAIYYTRLQQAKLIRKRIAMAWSSPVWTIAPGIDAQPDSP